MTESDIDLTTQDRHETTRGAAVASGIRWATEDDEQDIESALESGSVDREELVVSIE